MMRTRASPIPYAGRKRPPLRCGTLWCGLKILLIRRVNLLITVGEKLR